MSAVSRCKAKWPAALYGRLAVSSVRPCLPDTGLATPLSQMASAQRPSTTLALPQRAPQYPHAPLRLPQPAPPIRALRHRLPSLPSQARPRRVRRPALAALSCPLCRSKAVGRKLKVAAVKERFVLSIMAILALGKQHSALKVSNSSESCSHNQLMTLGLPSGGDIGFSLSMSAVSLASYTITVNGGNAFRLSGNATQAQSTGTGSANLPSTTCPITYASSFTDPNAINEIKITFQNARSGREKRQTSIEWPWIQINQMM